MTERKRRGRSRKTGEQLLFRETSDVPYTAPPLLVLTSNFSIGPLLSRGCLLSVDESLDQPDPDHGRRRLLSGTAPLSVAWMDALLASARNVIPIAVELAPERGVRRLTIAGTSMVVDAVCLSDVNALLFRTEKEMSRFSAIEFGNYSLETLEIPSRVDSTAFEAAIAGPTPAEPSPVEDTPGPEPAVDANVESLPKPSDGDVKSIVRRVDCLTGLVAYLLRASPATCPWMRGVQALLAGKHGWEQKASWPERLVAGILGHIGETKDTDRALLSAIVEVISRLPVEDGWAAEQVLSDVRRLSLQGVSAGDERTVREVSVWADRAAEILTAKAEPQSLADDAHVLSRAILLLLLRGDLDSIMNGLPAASGRQRPGPEVLGIASSLAAYRSGARALPARVKSGPNGHGSGRLTAYLGELFAALLQSGQRTLFPPGLPRPVLAYRHIKTLQGEWVLTVGGKELTRFAAVFDTALERLLTMGRDLGFEFEEHGDNGLATLVRQGDDRSRPVYLKVLRGDSVSGAVVRFSSPTLKLVGINSKSRLPRELLLDLLTRNAGPDMNCRFAIEEDEAVIVVLVDQLLGTLDEAEFRKHVEHVARVAADFELSRRGDAEVS